MMDAGGGVGKIDKPDAGKVADEPSKETKEKFEDSLDEAGGGGGGDTDGAGKADRPDAPRITRDDGGDGGDDHRGDEDGGDGTASFAAATVVDVAAVVPPDDDEPSPEVQAAIDDTMESAHQVNQYDATAGKIDHYLETFSEEDRKDYMEGLIEQAGENNFVAAGIARACENGNAEEIGEIVGELHDEGRITTSQVADLVDPALAGRIGGLEHLAVEARDMLIGTGDADLIADVAKELLERAPEFQDRIDRMGLYVNDYHGHYQTYETIIALADAALTGGNASAAEAIFETTWRDPDLRADMVSTLADYENKSGLEDLLQLMNRVDQLGDPEGHGSGNLEMKNQTETIFQEVLMNHGEAIEGNAAILDQLGIYFDNNVERLVEEAAFPHVDVPTTDPDFHTIAKQELDDAQLVSQFVDRVLLDPAYAGRSETIEKLGELNERLLDRIGDDRLDDGERRAAARMLGTVLGSYEQGMQDYLAREGGNLEGVAGFLKDLTDWAIEFFKAKNLPIVGGYIKQIRDNTLEWVMDQLNQNPEQFVEAMFGQLVEELNIYRATFPIDPQSSLGQDIDEAFEAGRRTANPADA